MLTLKTNMTNWMMNKFLMDANQYVTVSPIIVITSYTYT